MSTICVWWSVVRDLCIQHATTESAPSGFTLFWASPSVLSVYFLVHDYTQYTYFSVTGIFLVTDTPWSHAARIREVLLYVASVKCALCIRYQDWLRGVRTTTQPLSQALQSFGHLPLRTKSDQICASKQCCSSRSASTAMLRSTLRLQRHLAHSTLVQNRG